MQHLMGILAVLISINSPANKVNESYQSISYSPNLSLGQSSSQSIIQPINQSSTGKSQQGVLPILGGEGASPAVHSIDVKTIR